MHPGTSSYIPARKGELAAAIAANAGAAGLDALLKMLGAIVHFEALDQLERLKALYDRLDPDAAPEHEDARAAAFEAFEQALAEALSRANFTELEAGDVQTLDATKALTGLSIRASGAGIRRIRFFARGRRSETVSVRSFFGLVRRSIEVEYLDDVVILVGFKSEDEMARRDRGAFKARRGVRPGAALVKYFRNVAAPELVTLHPGARPSMRPRDQVFLAGPALVGGVPLLLNVWSVLPVIFGVLAAFFGATHAVANDDLRHALAASSGVLALGAFVMRQRMKFETQSLRYQKRLAETVYFRNLANNAGVLDLLVGAGEEQDVKEAFLAYAELLKAGRSFSKAELDKAIEQFLRGALKLDVDFEIQDALAKLERFGVVAKEGESYRALPVDQALARLDAAWDGYFNFAAQKP